MFAKLAWVATLIAVYLALFGAGARTWWVCAVGGAVGLLALALRVFGQRRTGLLRMYVFGTARVVDAPPPPESGLVGRCELELMVFAAGIDGVTVRVRDPAVPVSKWPEVGATLPVEVRAMSPRRTRVLWDQVLTHAMAEYDPYSGQSSSSDP
jgi:resuscitation-promoting factor RpfA